MEHVADQSPLSFSKMSMTISPPMLQESALATLVSKSMNAMSHQRKTSKSALSRVRNITNAPLVMKWSGAKDTPATMAIHTVGLQVEDGSHQVVGHGYWIISGSNNNHPTLKFD